MAQQLDYAIDAQRASKLRGELRAAGIPVLQMFGWTEATDDHPAGVRIIVPDGVDPAAVQAVVDAHDPDAPSPEEVLAAADAGHLQELAQTYQAGLAQLDATQAAMTAILNGPANPTLAQLTSAVRTIATEVRTAAVVQERTLKALRSLLRGQGVAGP